MRRLNLVNLYRFKKIISHPAKNYSIKFNLFKLTDSTYQEGNNSRVGANTMDEIITLIKQDLPEGRQSLKDSFTNLERVAEYCEDSYYR